MSAVAVSSANPVTRALAVTEWQARTFRHTWRATISTAFLNPIFFLLSVGVLLGTLIDDSNPALGGLSYVEFVAPGLLAVVAMQVGAGEGMYMVMAGIKWLKTYHAVIATPVRIGELVFGVLIWASLRIFTAAVIFTLVAGIGGVFESPLVALAPFAALLCGLAFFAPVSLVGAGAENEHWFPAIQRFALMPMFLFSGTFFPISQLPDWLEPLAWATPLWHGVTLCRDLATGTLAAADTAVHIAYLLSIIVVSLFVSVRIHRRRLMT